MSHCQIRSCKGVSFAISIELLSRIGGDCLDIWIASRATVQKHSLEWWQWQPLKWLWCLFSDSWTRTSVVNKEICPVCREWVQDAPTVRTHTNMLIRQHHSDLFKTPHSLLSMLWFDMLVRLSGWEIVKVLKHGMPTAWPPRWRICRYTLHDDLQWLWCERWMQPSFPLDSRQDKTYSLRDSINCTQACSIGQSPAQSLSLSVMLPAEETVAHARA